MPENNQKIGVFLGRFQPFHIGHMSIVEKIFAQGFERLLIIIGSAEKSRTDENPWTLQEREEIIRASIPLGLQEKIDIVGLDDTADDDVWCDDLEKIIQQVLGTKYSVLSTGYIVYTGNEWVRDLCEKRRIETNWIIPTIDISGTKVREMLRNKENVSDFVMAPEKILNRVE